MAAVQLKNISKHYGDTRILQGIDLQIADGEFVVLVGPSGCGKSTLMRMVAGLESISAGDFYIDHKRANNLPPQKRNISMVFQSYALYPHLTVFENIAFGPKLRKEAEASYRPRIEAVARMLNLEPYLDRLPRALSGGQRQRVAMGRAVVREPQVFLFDEPLSNLDAKLRVQMRAEIKALHQRLKNTVLYVTHDQIEAMTMGDRIVVMNGGQIEQIGKPLDLYDRPNNLFVAGFIGSPGMNFIEGTVTQSQRGAFLMTAAGAISLPPGSFESGLKMTLGIRPEHIKLDDQGTVTMRVDLVEPTGAETHVHGKIGAAPFCIAMRERLDITAEQELKLLFATDKLHLFDPSGVRLN